MPVHYRAHHELIDSYRRGQVEDAARRRLALEPLVMEDEDIERIEAPARATNWPLSSPPA